MLSFVDYINEKRFINTTTAPKLQVISNENEFIKKFIPIRGENEQIVGVVGEAKTGLQRHLNQYKDLGFTEKNIFIFEMLNHEYKNLWYFNNKVLKSQSTIIFGNIFAPRTSKVTNLNLSSVTHVDADITSAFNQDLVNEINQTFTIYPNLKSAVFVHSLRIGKSTYDSRINALDSITRESFYQKFVEFLKVSYSSNSYPSLLTSFKNLIEYSKTGTTSKFKIFDDMIKSFPNLSILIQSYQGKGPMVSITVVKGDGERVIKSDISPISETDRRNFSSFYNKWMSRNYEFYDRMFLFRTKSFITLKEYKQINRTLNYIHKILQEN